MYGDWLFVGATGKDLFHQYARFFEPVAYGCEPCRLYRLPGEQDEAEITNRFGGKSEMTEFTPDYIRVQVTPQSTWQMKLLSVNDSTRLICTVSTVCAPACDSHIKFYTTDWKELPSAPYLASLPGMDDFIMPASDTIDVYRYQDARLQADMLLMKADLSGKDATLTFTFTTPDYMEREAAEKLKPFLRRPVSYTWKEGKFIR